jgi:hypothetical protein
MAKSKAKKERDHLLRTRGRDVTVLRAPGCQFSTHERKTMTKKERSRKSETKHKKRYLQKQHLEDNAFFICNLTIIPKDSGIMIWKNPCLASAKNLVCKGKILLLGFFRKQQYMRKQPLFNWRADSC